MVTIFRIHNGGAPSYLNYIIPDKHKNVSSYNTRNKHDCFIPRCRLELFFLKIFRTWFKKNFMKGRSTVSKTILSV